MSITNHSNSKLLELMPELDLGSSIAEQDKLLKEARVETSVFYDLASDKVDLVPGTKGSGKSALFRIFVEFLPAYFLDQRKVVIAHGVNHTGDSVFHVFKSRFEKLSENDFVNFWCIYIVSLVHEQFIKSPFYSDHLVDCNAEVESFRQASRQARIPDIPAKKSLRDILEWTLNALKVMKPSLTFKPPGDFGEVELSLFGDSESTASAMSDQPEVDLPQYMGRIRDSIEGILSKCGLSIWLMIDKLDEIFPRRSKLERKALRGLLRTMRVFDSEQVRLKIFLRDDMLNEVVGHGEGFTALTHIVARKADTLKWSQDQVLTMVVNRLFSSERLRSYLDIDLDKLKASQEYRNAAFYTVFPAKVHKGKNQSPTARWIYNHTADGNGVATPRDVIDLLTRAKQKQHDLLLAEASGTSESIISPRSILYGFGELSDHKRTTYLKAEFPHLWPDIDKFSGGKAEYAEKAIRNLLGKKWKDIATDLRSIGFLSERKTRDDTLYTIPPLYRKALNLTQGVQRE